MATGQLLEAYAWRVEGGSERRAAGWQWHTRLGSGSEVTLVIWLHRRSLQVPGSAKGLSGDHSQNPTPFRGRQSFCAARVGIPRCRVEAARGHVLMVMPVPLMMVPFHNVRVQTPSSPLQNRASRGETLRWAWRGRRFVGRFSRFFFSLRGGRHARHRQVCGASIGGRRISRWIRDLESTPSPIVTRASRRSVAASSRAQTRQTPEACHGCYGSGQAGAQRQR